MEAERNTRTHISNKEAIRILIKGLHYAIKNKSISKSKLFEIQDLSLLLEIWWCSIDGVTTIPLLTYILNEQYSEALILVNGIKKADSLFPSCQIPLELLKLN